MRGCAAILRVAVGLDRNHDGAVAQVEVSKDDPVVITVRPQDELGPGHDLSFECWSANERTALLASLLGVPVEVRQA